MRRLPILALTCTALLWATARAQEKPNNDEPWAAEDHCWTLEDRDQWLDCVKAHGTAISVQTGCFWVLNVVQLGMTEPLPKGRRISDYVALCNHTVHGQCVKFRNDLESILKEKHRTLPELASLTCVDVAR
jgi:hypothetical protein